MGKVIKSIFGGGAKPKASSDAADGLAADASNSAKKRAALFETQGGITGQEIDPNNVQKRNTLLGN